MTDENATDRRIEWSRNDDPTSFAVHDDTLSLAALDALDPFFDEMRSALEKRQLRDWCEREAGCEGMPATCLRCGRCLGHCACQ